jgi:hypothetical protein
MTVRKNTVCSGVNTLLDSVNKSLRSKDTKDVLNQKAAPQNRLSAPIMLSRQWYIF